MSRIYSVDLFRLLGIFGVIVIHSYPLNPAPENTNDLYIYGHLIADQLARFAVPFFFVISGYFWGAKVRKGSCPLATARAMAKRIAIIFFSWSFIYILPLNFASIVNFGLLGPVKVSYWNLFAIMHNPLIFVFQGTALHLWFLVGLLFSLGICAFFLNKGWLKTLIALSIVLYIIGVLSKAYLKTPLGIVTPELDFETAHVFSPLLFVTGYILSKYDITTSWFFYGLGVFFAGSLMHFSEAFMLWKYFDVNLRHDFVFGTYFMGLGAAMASLSNHPWLQSQKLSEIGRLTLGIYAVHGVFLGNLSMVNNYMHSPIWEVSEILLVFLLSVFTAYWLSRNRITSNIVM